MPLQSFTRGPMCASLDARPMSLPRLLSTALLLALLRRRARRRRRSPGHERGPASASSAPRASALAVRVMPAQTAPIRFNLVGLHWRGAGTVVVPHGRAGGGWSAWRAARPEAEDLPDAGTAEAAPARGLEAREPVLDGRGAPDPVPPDRSRPAASGALPLERLGAGLRAAESSPRRRRSRSS